MNPWAAHRRMVVFLIVGAVVAAIVAIIAIAAFYKAPTCTDGKQNQDEVGVDCGGSCAYLCTAQAIEPTVLFASPLRTSKGRTDIIASVENKNISAAAKNVRYSVKLYTTNLSFIKEVIGTIDLPARSVVPVFIPNAVLGAEVTRAVFSIDTASLRWYTLESDPRIVPEVSRTALGGTTDAPRVEAVFTNPSITRLTNIRALALVYGANGNVIAASDTLLPTIPAQGDAAATFIWNDPFTSTPSRIEVTSVVPLP